MGRARLAFALCLVIAGTLGAAGVAGAPPPVPLCGVCGPSTANDAEIAGATGHGTLDVYVDDEGDSRWEATVPVAESAAERYRANESALAAAVEDAWARSHVALGDVRAVESSVEDGAVVVNYTVEDVAEPGVGGAWIVNYFATGASATRYEMAAERVTIQAPAGTVVTNDPAGAAVDGTTATWTREGGGIGEFDEQTYVTYGGDSPLGTASGYATLATETGPTALDHGVRGGVIPAVLLAFTGFAIGHTGFGRDAFDAATLERLIVAVGAVGVAGFLVVGAATAGDGLAPSVVALASMGAGYALLGALGRRLGDRLETRGLVGLAVLATVIAAGIARLLGTPAYAVPLAFGLATALCLPIGYASERGRTPVALVAFAALTPIAAVAAVAPVYAFGYPAVYGLLLVPWVAVVAAFGYPVALLGRRLALE